MGKDTSGFQRESKKKAGHTMAYQIMTLSGFINEVRMVSQGPHPRKFCFVLGAGASKTSGIKTGEELVEIWERELTERNPQAHEEWKNRLGITERNRGNFYSNYYQRRFEKDDGKRYRDGYNYLEQMMNKAHPSGGYVYLSLIMAGTENQVVITTNFDHLVEDALLLYGHEMPMVIGHEKLAPYATGTIARPTVVKIHRDLLLDPISDPKELDRLHDEWVEVLDNLFTHYHPVFIGYAGNDNSVMDFLCENVDKFNDKKWAYPYWLIYGNQQPEGKVAKFLRETDGYLISHGGFDQVMVKLGDALGQRLPSKEKFLEQTQKQYENLMDSAARLLKNESLDGGRQQSAGNDDRPEESLDSLISGSPFSEEVQGADEGVLYSRYLALQINGEYGKALGYIQLLVRQYPDNHRYHYSLGVTLHEMKQYEEAAEEKKAAIKLEPGIARYHDSLSDTLYAMKQLEESVEEERKAIELEPENSVYYSSLGLTLNEMKRYEEALEVVRKAVELEPEEALNHVLLSMTLYDLKRYNAAVEESRKAIELDPENPDYYDSLAITLRAMGQKEEAAEQDKKAEELRAAQQNT